MKSEAEIKEKIKEINQMVFTTLAKQGLSDQTDDHGPALWGMYCNALRWVLEEAGP